MLRANILKGSNKIHNILSSPDYLFLKNIDNFNNKDSERSSDIEAVECIQSILLKNNVTCMEIIQEKEFLKLKCHGNIVSQLSAMNRVEEELPKVQISFQEIKNIENNTESIILILYGSQKNVL